jgi:hypothetical protein
VWIGMDLGTPGSPASLRSPGSSASAAVARSALVAAVHTETRWDTGEPRAARGKPCRQPALPRQARYAPIRGTRIIPVTHKDAVRAPGGGSLRRTTGEYA